MKKLMIILLISSFLISGCTARMQEENRNNKEVENNDNKLRVVEEKYEITEHSPLKFDFNQQIAVKYAGDIMSVIVLKN